MSVILLLNQTKKNGEAIIVISLYLICTFDETQADRITSVVVRVNGQARSEGHSYGRGDTEHVQVDGAMKEDLV